MAKQARKNEEMAAAEAGEAAGEQKVRKAGPEAEGARIASEGLSEARDAANEARQQAADAGDEAARAAFRGEALTRAARAERAAREHERGEQIAANRLEGVGDPGVRVTRTGARTFDTGSRQAAGALQGTSEDLTKPLGFMKLDEQSGQTYRRPYGSEPRQWDTKAGREIPYSTNPTLRTDVHGSDQFADVDAGVSAASREADARSRAGEAEPAVATGAEGATTGA